MNLTDKTGLLAGQMLVHESEDVLLMTDDGTVIRMSAADITKQGRNTMGVRVMRVLGDSRVACLTCADAEEEEAETAEATEAPAEE